MKEKKKILREKIWRLLEEKGVARFPLPLKDRIPNFEGSDQASKLVSTLQEWKKAKIIFANPDFAQQKVRELALREGKVLIMATPKLKEGYLRIDPKEVKGREEEASTIAGAFRFGKKLGKLPKPDLIITGCAAVDKKGWRLGKGGGYGDREIAIFIKEFGKIIVVTILHDLQIVEEVPHQEFDTQVDYMVTPSKIIKSQPRFQTVEGS
jgi:5-formyltetrahydrofolate cyclo-ligase